MQHAMGIAYALMQEKYAALVLSSFWFLASLRC